VNFKARDARLLTWALIGLAVAFLAYKSISAVLAKVGHSAAALDDAYIHYQYARAIAEGHPMRFQAGEPVSSGATSMLWPVLLAPFWLLGARDDAIVWPAWLLSYVALGALAWEAAKLTERLAGRAAAAGAAAMTLTFGGFVWCAASGMEVVPFAWAMARTLRLGSEWTEVEPEQRTRRRAVELAAMAWVAALFRPEGALAAIFAAVTLAVVPRVSRRDRALAAVAVVGAFALPLLLWAITGSPRSNTAVAKLMPGNPYYAGHALVGGVQANVKLLLGTLLQGEVWSAEFLPHGGAPLAMAGLGAIAICGWRTKSRWRMAAVLLLALTMFAPCFYVTFLWNRLRYLWPFMTGWLVGLACLARVLGDLAASVRPRWRLLGPIACGAFVGLLASKDEWVIDDVAQSASGIDRQQVALGRWAKLELPATARIGVNDTGAIAYFGERKTFDVVGLTTEGEARYWVAGVGSRLEHYERMRASSPAALPTHFIVYPEWMGMDVVLGRQLHEATVTDSTILGGQTMRAYAADWSKLGTGDAPWTDAPGPLIDAVDVADLQSEADHDYELLGAHENEQAAHEGISPDGATVVDGGRTRRTRERFVAHLRAGLAARGIVRIDGLRGTRIVVRVDGEPADQIVLDDDEDWAERTFEVPARLANDHARVELDVDTGAVTTFHYWFCAITPG
jgi:hypothetical protein